MGDRSAIEWTDATWNPVRGCSRVSEGCRNCYAERVAARFSGPGLAYEGLATMRNGEPRWTGEVRVVEEHLRDPLRWKRPRRVFVNSMSDLFHERLPDAAIDRVFAVMALSPQHTFQVLTKRPEWMCAYLGGNDTVAAQMERLGAVDDASCEFGACHANLDGRWPLPNVWLGVSAENQATADERIPLLLQTPAAVRFVSAEPLLGPISLRPWLIPTCTHCGGQGSHYVCERDGKMAPALDWIIAGGESGPGARPMHRDWARSIRDECHAAGVAFFFKQWGEWGPHYSRGSSVSTEQRRVGKKEAGRLLDGRTWDEFPRKVAT